jgi:two-component system, cell cycle response regulator DivK
MDLFTSPSVHILLALVAAMLAGAVGGFFFRGWIDRRQQERRGRARGALRSSATARRYPFTPSPAWPEPDSLRSAGHAQAGDHIVATSAQSPTRSVGPASGATVLIVDDRYETRAVIAACLAGNGYRIVEAADGDEALHAVRRERPDAILLDHSMPNRTGLEVVDELKADPATASIPIIFMTAHSYGAVGRKAMAAGCASYLPKPCNPTRVLQEVTRHTRVGRH